MTALVEGAREELYGLSPEAFTGRRNELVRELKRAGDRDAASAVAALRRPAVHLWAVNHLARERALAVTRLLSAAANLAAAQESALKGEDGAGARLRQDSGEYQRSLDLAVREASGLVRDAGRAASEETTRRVREILAGAALGDEEVRSALASGSLSEEPVGPGLGAFGFGSSGDAAPRMEAQRRLPTRPVARATVARVDAVEPAPPPDGDRGPGPDGDDRRARHRRRLDARREAETALATVKRLTDVARRARRRAAVAAAAAASADEEASEAEARLTAAQEAEEHARVRYEGLQTPG